MKLVLFFFLALAVAAYGRAVEMPADAEVHGMVDDLTPQLRKFFKQLGGQGRFPPYKDGSYEAISYTRDGNKYLIQVRIPDNSVARINVEKDPKGFLTLMRISGPPPPGI